MEIQYRSHAVERMIQRGISPRDLDDVLQNPDGVIRQSMDKVIAYKNIEDRTDNSIAVIAVESDQAWEVITVMINFEVRQ